MLLVPCKASVPATMAALFVAYESTGAPEEGHGMSYARLLIALCLLSGGYCLVGIDVGHKEGILSGHTPSYIYMTLLQISVSLIFQSCSLQVSDQ